MPDFKMGNPAKTVISQSGTANPTWGTGVPTGAVINFVQNTDTVTTSRTSSYFVTYCHCDITVKEG